MSDKIAVVRDIESPSGGWKFVVPETGVTVKAPFYKNLRNRAKAHLEANGLAVPDEASMQDKACADSGLAYPFCGKEAPRPIAGMPLLTLGMASRFVKTVLAAVQDRKFVSQEEAQRRATICGGSEDYNAETGVGNPPCDRAVEIGGCRPCSSVFKTIDKLLVKSPVTLPAGKEFCANCGCYLTAKIWLENSTLNRAEEGTNRPEYPSHCWRQGGDSGSP